MSSVPLSWPDPTHDRLDAVCLRWAREDPHSWMELIVITGTPSVDPQLPPIPEGYHLLAQLQVHPNVSPDKISFRNVGADEINVRVEFVE